MHQENTSRNVIVRDDNASKRPQPQCDCHRDGNALRKFQIEAIARNGNASNNQSPITMRLLEMLIHQTIR
jgi:hypothetical protein